MFFEVFVNKVSLNMKTTFFIEQIINLNSFCRSYYQKHLIMKKTKITIRKHL